MGWNHSGVLHYGQYSEPTPRLSSESLVQCFFPTGCLIVQITPGIVCSVKVTHRPFEILRSTLRSQQYQGTEFQEPIAPSLPARWGSVNTEADPYAQTVLLAGSCKGSGLAKVTNSGMSR